MSDYLTHMEDMGAGTAFGRRLEYIRYNFRAFLDRLDPDKHRVLEIGPGTGELLQVLNDRGFTNIDILDNDRAIVEHCRKYFKVSKGILSKSNDLSRSVTAKYDLIVLTQVFEHIPKTDYMHWLGTLYGALNPGGQIVITVPNGANPLSGTERYGDLQHENIFTVYSFRELMTFANLKKSSFVIQGFEIPPTGPVNIIRIILQKILHGIFILMMIVNGAIYQTLMTPNISLIITKSHK